MKTKKRTKAEINRENSKKRLRDLEAVYATMRVIIAPVAFEVELCCTRAELEFMQRAHANDTLMINWIKEVK